MPRIAKQFVVIMLDCSACILATWLAFYLRLGEFVPLVGPALWAACVSIMIALPLFVISGMYRVIFRHSGWPVIATVLKITSLYGLIYSTIYTAIGVQGVPRTIGFIQPILLVIVVSISRALAHFWLGGLYQRQLKLASLPQVLIYGAGNSGRQLALALSNSHDMRIVGFLDDDTRLQGKMLNGLTVYRPGMLPELVTTLNIKTVLLALPQTDRKRRNAIIHLVHQARVSVRTIPSFNEMARGKASMADLQELDIEDLLSREPVDPNHLLFAKNITGKVVMVTGAGGSIGSEICRQVLSAHPSTLLLLEQNEGALYQIHQELANLLENAVTIIPLLASVRESSRVVAIMETWRPYTVYHAAAYKHVPLVEHNPTEGIKNNVLGTLSIAKAAIQCKVQNFVLVSTDKAVRPTNVMGASKRLAEIILQALAATGAETIFSMVRFGNVLDSSGSVVPKFRTQIREGGPITLTHPEVTRYFMTIPEAAQLVIQAGAMAEGGDVFVLDMGKPVKIVDLAHRIVELSGLTVRDELNPDGDIEIKLVGLRPGEKLYEELLIGNDPKRTKHPRIMKASEEFIEWAHLENQLLHLEDLIIGNNIVELIDLLQQLNLGYLAEEKIVDWIYIEKTAK